MTEAGEGPGPEEPAPVALSTRHPWRVAIVVLVAVAAAVVIGGALWVHAESGATRTNSDIRAKERSAWRRESWYRISGSLG